MTTTLKELQARLQGALDELVDAWFPTVIDDEHGGYLCDFDHRWRNRGPHDKLLEFQARTLRFVTRVAGTRPQLEPCSEHGFRFLADVMSDSLHGGFYHLVDRSGAPLNNGTKHGHGCAYAISACVLHYRLTGNREALDLACRTFDWLEEHAHDANHGGYFSYYDREGTPILEPRNRPDPLGNPIGCKDANTTLDLIEAFGQLLDIWPEPRLEARLEELMDIALSRMIVTPGAVHSAFTQDWHPVPNLTNYAYCLQAARILLDADRSLSGDEPCDAVLTTAKSLVDNMLRVAWDKSHGGFHQAGTAFGAYEIEGCRVFVPDKIWWCQAEGLRALLTLAALLPDSDYDDRAADLWRYIEKHILDRRYGGWQRTASDSVRYDRRAAKSWIWKDPCHEGLALLIGVELCEANGLPEAPDAR